MNKTEIVGAWKLVHYKIFLDKAILFPFGEDGLGYLIYTVDDHMSIQFMRSQRPKLPSDDFRSLSPEVKQEIAENFGGYSGKYEISEGTIIHYPEIASFPNFIFSPQVRNFALSPPLLVLSCDYFCKETQKTGRSEITWKRCK